MIEPAQVFPVGAERPPCRLIDVRAPLEVARGELPFSVNVPILEDEERRQVGIAYKRDGQEAAIEVGFELTAHTMASRVTRWREVCGEGPAAISCWRGGLRSSLAQRFLGEPDVPRVAGGYKGLRGYLMAGLKRQLEQRQILVVSGMTGTGKTALLASLKSSPALLGLDLEALARHRGSAFGSMGEQPAQQTFENQLAAEVLLSRADVVLLEDESRRIGALHIPGALFERMAASPLLLLEAPLEQRICRIHREYIVEPCERLGPERAIQSLREATARLRRRLGGGLQERLDGILSESLRTGEWRDVATMAGFIGPLLSDYYDPLYLRALWAAGRPVAARGSGEELANWIRQELTQA